LKLPYEWQIGWRYTRASKRTTGNGFISFIALVSMAGIALGVAALIVVLSVMNGFQKEVRDRMLSVLAHVEIFSPTGSMPNWQLTAQEARRNPEVIGAAPYVEAQALLTRQGAVSGVALRGVEPSLEPEVSDIGKEMRAGKLTDLKPGEFGIVLGKDLAANLGVTDGDKITLVAPEGTITPAGMMPRLKQFTVVGIFSSGHFEFDSALALVNMHDAETLFRLSGPTGVRLKLQDMQRAPQVADALAGTLSGELYLRDWSKQNRNWFAAVQTEKRMMFIILTLIIAVAAFNLVSTLVMTVTDKQADIAILRTMGAQPGSIMKIFIVQGVAIGFIGTVLGVVGGTLIATNIDVIVPFIERLLHVQFLPRDIYFISELPSDPRVNDIATIGIISFVLATLATLYPSWRAARVNPAEALRYE
jgi:lipoprotein-releasing system permease protein